MKNIHQFGFDLRVTLRSRLRKPPVNRPKKALHLPLTDEQKEWQHRQQIVWWAQLLQDEVRK